MLAIEYCTPLCQSSSDQIIHLSSQFFVFEILIDNKEMNMYECEQIHTHIYIYIYIYNLKKKNHSSLISIKWTLFS